MQKRLRTISGRVSPPPLKRQTQTAAAAAPAAEPVPATPGALRIFSWNVNGIVPFVQNLSQNPISAFFQPVPIAGHKRSRRGTQDDSSEDDVTTDSKRGGNQEAKGETENDPAIESRASLRLVLRRHQWPHILLLQEVKIKPADAQMMAMIKATVNMPESNNNGKLETPGMGKGGVITGVKKQPEDGKLQDGGPEYEVHFNLPADPQNAKGFGGKVYGVAAIIRKDFVHRYVEAIRDVAWDREGRIQVIETREVSFPVAPGTLTTSFPPNHEGGSGVQAHSQGNPTSGAKLAIINIYAVNGTSSPYYDTYTGAEVGTRHDRKLAVHTELLREAHDLQRRGFQVLLAGDLNIARSELDGYPNLRTWPRQHVLNRADFNAKFFTNEPIKNTASRAAYSRDSVTGMGEDPLQGLDGVDTFRHLHGPERRYSYYPRGRPWGTSCDRVDLIIASRALADCILAAGICDSPRDRGPSDHCPIWVEIGRRAST